MIMKIKMAIAAVALATIVGTGAATASTQPGCWPSGTGVCECPNCPCPCCCFGGPKGPPCYNWHANYAHFQYGQPLALVVPPTANLQTNWGWGVSSSRISRLDHQFGRNYPGPGPHGGQFRNTPRWAQDTMQFGVYSVRGPW